MREVAGVVSDKRVAKIYRTGIRPIKIYSIEKWALARIEERKLERTVIGKGDKK